MDGGSHAGSEPLESRDAPILAGDGAGEPMLPDLQVLRLALAAVRPAFMARARRTSAREPRRQSMVCGVRVVRLGALVAGDLWPMARS
jgi:hypothetical protein